MNLATVIHWAAYVAAVIFAVAVVVSTALVMCRALGAWWRARL